MGSRNMLGEWDPPRLKSVGYTGRGLAFEWEFNSTIIFSIPTTVGGHKANAKNDQDYKEK